MNAASPNQLTGVERLLAELISVPSMNPMGRGAGAEYAERAIADLVANELRRSGVDVEVREVSPGRPNVVARLDYGAPESILLEAHLDTVRADGMEIPPFVPNVRNGRMMGRGACDTKGSLATFLHAVCAVAKRKSRLPRNVVFAAVADEEYGFTGARRLAGEVKADFGIVGEPTRLRIVRAHKGVLRWRIETRGRAAHSAYPERGENAIYGMARIVRALEGYAAELRKSPAHPLLGSPTLSVGVIEGGEAVNVVPDRCRIEIDRRLLPGETEESVLDAIRNLLSGESGWVLAPPHLSVAGMEVAKSNPGLLRLAAAAHAVIGAAEIESAPYATDAGIYNASGIPTVVFGPGDIADAHTANESIELGEVASAVEIVMKVLTE